MGKDEKTKRDDDWAKERGYTLLRDSCPECIKRWERGDQTYFGDTMFCSREHAHEVSNLKKEEFYRSAKEEILGAIDKNIMSIEKAEKIIEDIENRYL